MRRNWILLALLLSFGVNCGLVGMAIVRHRPAAPFERGVRPAPRAGERLADRLELEGETRESFLRLQRQLAERMRGGRREIERSRRELRRELTSAAPDRARAEELLVAIGREQAAMDRALVENVLASRELLDGRGEREYLRFIERFAETLAGARPPGPPGGALRKRSPRRPA
jgi:Spy/CpxP family protein refolding chaperone